MHDLHALEVLARELAMSAGEILLEGRRSGFGVVDTKSSSVDIVTETDRATEAHIVSLIRERRPDDGILGEEGASREGTSGVRWLIDPLDGTVNFTYGIPAFAVSVGITVDDEPVVGVVYNPVTAELFSAVTGEGAYLNDQPITAGSETQPKQSLVATGFSYIADVRAAEAALLLDVLPSVRDIRRMGSAALDLCSVACGRVDAYFEGAVMPWDVAAGQVIATEAGARVTSLSGAGRPTKDIFAANPALYDTLLPMLQRGRR